MTESTDRPTPSAFDHAAWQAAKTERSNRNDLVSVLGAAVVAAGAVVVTLVLRLLDVFGTDGTRVPVFFDAVDAVLPGAAGVGSFTIDQGSVVVADLPVVTFVCVLLAAILPAIANLVVIVCAFRFFRRLLRGDAFAPGNARLLSIASIAILCGWIADTWFGTMASNGALAAATDGAVEGTPYPLTWIPFFVAMAVGGLAIAFRAGERLRADTEGLV
ncbi:DUF2975 domain-containing protein [Plantibacter cousiniae (nom. nud.)]|uniref:DUF2975 domain-containing protein n=1 Tax=Plantibacter cousiniae (nom. nud.) TaxID=199709 RepID=A0ABY1LT20_9MICO|nr:DUF2975 domain-containing protein [Plantibacter cousiniae]SKC71082.1 hypothetical protein SAMN06295973_3311 [Plantibacter cousiniae]